MQHLIGVIIFCSCSTRTLFNILENKTKILVETSHEDVIAACDTQLEQLLSV